MDIQRLGRRAFLQNGTLLLAATANSTAIFGDAAGESIRFGLVTDLHYADKPPAGTRHYRESATKLAEAAAEFRKSKVDFVVELGDLIDAAATVDDELAYLKTIDQEFSAIARDRHYVLGNHCVDTLTKAEFLKAVGQDQSYYSFDRRGIHFIVLDACFRSDGTPYGRKNFEWNDANVPQQEMDWLRDDLRQASGPVIVFAHQRLDVSNSYGVKNNAEIRKILETSGKVQAVFQGHNHVNDLKEVGGIHYCTLVAMVEGAGAENSGFSVATADADGTIRVQGFRRHKGYQWTSAGNS